MKSVTFGIACIFTFVVGCTGTMHLKSTNTRDRLIDNLSADLAEVNLMVENARKGYQSEPLDIRIIDAWSLAKEEQILKVRPSPAKLYTVLQRSTIEVPTALGPMLVEVSKIQSEDGKFVGIARPDKFGTLTMKAPVLAEVDGYSIKQYDPALKLDAAALDAVRAYVTRTVRFEKTAKIIFKKMLEIQEKYKYAAVSIESFQIHLPLISIEIQFKVRPG